MTKPVHLLVAAIATAATIAGCGGDGGGESSVPTEAEARAAFDTKFEQAQSGDPEAFCGDTEVPDMCKSQWERLGGAGAIPKEKPRVASVREQDGYRVVRVCGQDGTGRDYRSDFVVGLDEGEVAYALPVFWNGATFSGVHGDGTGKVDAAEPDAAPTDCS